MTFQQGYIILNDRINMNYELWSMQKVVIYQNSFGGTKNYKKSHSD